MRGRFLPLIRGPFLLMLRRPHTKNSSPHWSRADNRRRIFGLTPGLRHWLDPSITTWLLSIEDSNRSKESS